MLKQLSFSAQAGKVVALVGPSGAGKSTIASLLLRFYDPQQGRILFDGRPPPITACTNCAARWRSCRRKCSSSAARLRKISPTESRARPSRKSKPPRAAPTPTISSRNFPKATQPLVGERGVKVSGGQRQRIAIARALLKDPSILILDEATSALDAESERLVQQALEELMKGRTCFVIAHRLSTIRNADTIVMLRDGAVRETGSHDELMLVPDGAYRRMVELQHGANVFTGETEVPALE